MVARGKSARKRVLVVGGGIAGATVADRLARAGVEVRLVEKKADLGGRVREMGCKATDTCLRCNVCVADRTLRTIGRTPGVSVHTSTEMVRLGPGRNARFSAVLVPAGAGAGHARAMSVDADAVVLATGHSPYEPAENSSLGYGRMQNVITGADAERQLAVRNRVTRPSDGGVPARVAFIQCVGSRTEEVFRRPEDTNYCSTVCCAYALRIAQRIKHQAPDTAVTVFYMDIQNFGKGFDAFYGQCKDKLRLVRSRPYEISPDDNGSVRVKYAAEGAGAEKSVCEEGFDLVILSVGIRPAADGIRLAEQLGVAVDGSGFLGLKGGSCMPDLQREGIYAVGTCESPKDIAGTMAQAEAVSAELLRGT
jgi:heterodisulfide reductase subunit A